jgi:GAF domain-containing protein
VGAVFAFPLLAGGIALGALDVYSRQRGELADADVDDALMLADLAALAIQYVDAPASIPGVDLDAETSAPWAHPAVVHNATGMVSEQLNIDVDEALLRLRALAFVRRAASSTWHATSSRGGCWSKRGAIVSDPSLGGPSSRESLIVDAFLHLADTLVEDYDVIEFFHFLTERCVELVEIDEAAIMLVSPSRRLEAVASSSERSRLLELFELQNREGPCLDAFHGRLVVSSSDLANEEARWPIFAPQALAFGFRAVHSIPLRRRDDVVGALNLLRVEPGELSPVDARLVGALSEIATVGLLQARMISDARVAASGLQTALNSRILIEQAKGVLAQRHDIDMDAAFTMLRNHARRHQLRLTVVAERVVNRTLELAGDSSRSE